MPVDPRMFAPFNLGELMRNAEAIRGSQNERAYRDHTMARQSADDQRAATYRGSIADFLNPPEGVDRNAAFATAVRADPTAALTARNTQMETLGKQLDTIGAIAGAATDQPSYDAARQRLLGMGLDVSHLPEQFDPAITGRLLNEAMTARERVAASVSEARLENDIIDDDLDNERADENLESLRSYREGQLANTRRGQDLTDRRGRRGQDLTHQRGQSRAPSPNSVIGRILEKQAAGTPLTPGETQILNTYNSRGQGRGRSQPRQRGGAPQNGAIIRNPQTGQRMRLQNGRWVPIG